MKKPDQANNFERVVHVIKLKKLQQKHIQKIDELLSYVGAYGEIRLVIQHGEIRYINVLESHSVLTKPS